MGQDLYWETETKQKVASHVCNQASLVQKNAIEQTGMMGEKSFTTTPAKKMSSI
jgi:hypothetical protein